MNQQTFAQNHPQPTQGYSQLHGPHLWVKFDVEIYLQITFVHSYTYTVKNSKVKSTELHIPQWFPVDPSAAAVYKIGLAGQVFGLSRLSRSVIGWLPVST